MNRDAVVWTPELALRHLLDEALDQLAIELDNDLQDLEKIQYLTEAAFGLRDAVYTRMGRR